MAAASSAAVSAEASSFAARSALAIRPLRPSPRSFSPFAASLSPNFNLNLFLRPSSINNTAQTRPAAAAAGPHLQKHQLRRREENRAAAVVVRSQVASRDDLDVIPLPPTTTSSGSDPLDPHHHRHQQDDQGPDLDKRIDRAINAAIVLAAGTFAITKLLTIDSEYWHGWTIYEILRYAPQHNWIAYEQALKTNPVLAKMMISGVVYSLGDWIAQCYEGKPLFDFDRTRMFRSGLVGFTLHGSLSHYYYYFCEALFPSQDWWVVPAKVLFDQTVWAAIWNSIYYVALGFLRFESPVNIFSELKATFWPMLTAGWKLWPFAHLITYGVIPVEQRLLWVDCVELVWVTILSTYSNEKSEARSLEATSDSNTRSLEE